MSVDEAIDWLQETAINDVSHWVPDKEAIEKCVRIASIVRSRIKELENTISNSEMRFQDLQHLTAALAKAWSVADDFIQDAVKVNSVDASNYPGIQFTRRISSIRKLGDRGSLVGSAEIHRALNAISP